MAATNSSRSGIALDVGAKRIGVASANLGVRFAAALTTLERPADFMRDIVALCRQEDAAWVVIGLPRGLAGQDTAQTEHARAFGAELEHSLAAAGLTIPVYWIDEALTSAKAEAELHSRPSSRRSGYSKGEVDALAATYILEDFLREQPAYKEI